MFPISNIPISMRCPCCGNLVIERLSTSQRFEVFVAESLKGKIAGYETPGYDVYESEILPGLTFQVKGALTKQAVEKKQIVSHGKSYGTYVSSQWYWAGNSGEIADWYILFGVQDDLVHVFAIPYTVWLERTTASYLYGRKRRQISIVTRRKSQRGRRGIIQNRFWEYEIQDWPHEFIDKCKQTIMTSAEEFMRSKKSGAGTQENLSAKSPQSQLTLF